MIVNNAAFLRSLRNYIKYNWYVILYENGDKTITDRVLDRVEQEYCFDIAQAENSLADFSEERMEVVATILNDAFVRQYEHGSTFADLNKHHILRVHN